MSVETQVVALLVTLCPRVHPDVAPDATATPYVTYQTVGGRIVRYVENTAADKRNPYIQINVWSKTRGESFGLIQQIENALCSHATLATTPRGEAVAVFEEATKLYGYIQDFDIWGAR